jgi:hypothetical protein
VVFSIKLSEKVGFRGFNDTTEADSAVSMRPRTWIQRLNETAEADLAVSMTPLKQIQQSQ